MKIQNDTLHAVQPQNDAKVKPKHADGFEALLAERLPSPQATEEAASQAIPPLPFAAARAPSLADVVSQTAALREDGAGMSLGGVAQRIEGLFDSLDAYAASLNSSGGAGLRNAYALLQDMDKDIRDIHAKAPDLAGRHAGLAALVSEIEVMAAAEGFKMNRGDYLL